MENMNKFLAFDYNTCVKLREIFAEHCNLSMEQYEEISGQFIFLVSDIIDCEPQADIERRMDYMRAVFEFLYNTKELTIKEYTDLQELLEDVWDKGRKMMAEQAIREGTVL